MSALEDARAARDKFASAEMKWDDSPVLLRNALDALIAEHERLTEDLRITDEIAVGLERKRQAAVAELERLTERLEEAYRIGANGWGKAIEKAEEVKRLTAPPADDEREALYDGAWRAISGRNEPWGGCAEREKVMRVAEFAAGFRRQGPITDAQVDAAVLAFHEVEGSSEDGHAYAHRNMRVALEAARGAS